MVTEQTAPRRAAPRKAAAKPAPGAVAAGAGAAADVPKTLLGQGVGKHTEAALAPAPLPPRGPGDCVLCGDPVPTEKVSWPFRPEPTPSGEVLEHRACPDIPACLERAFSRPSRTPSEDAADHAPFPALESPPETVEPPLEPLPEGDTP
jgi:hypothetical protein